MTDVSSGDEKGVIFLSLLALSRSVNNFVQEELFVLKIFTLNKNQTNPFELPQYCQYLLALYLDIVACISTANYALV